MTVHFETEKRYRLDLVMPSSADGTWKVAIQENVGGDEWKQVGESDRIGVKKTIEFAVGFDQLGLKAGDPVRFHVRIHKGHIEMERWPRDGYIEFSVPGEDFEATMWFV